MKISIIIPTYSRAKALERCIKSILQQTHLPDEIIIIDDGELKKLPFLEEFVSKGINYVYKKKKKKGVVDSRNIGSDIANGDIVFLLEDDVVLFPDYVEQIIKVYEKFPDVKGVGGVIAEKKSKNWLAEIYSYFFLLSSFRPARVLPSGFDTFDFSEKKISKLQQVEFLAGGVCSFKKEVFKEFKFSMKYQDKTGYAQGEDREFGFRVSRKYKLMLNPEAKVYHFREPKAKLEARRRTRNFILSRFIFFKEHLSKKRWRWILFFYSFFGYTLWKAFLLFASFKESEIEKFKGILDALKEIVEGSTSC